MDKEYNEISVAVRKLAHELLAEASLKPGNILVLGCSSSEILGARIGKASSAEVGMAVLQGILPVARENGLYLAVQCCEHLNRALVIEEDAVERFGLEVVSVIPVITAGGACGTAAYQLLQHPAVVERISAHAGIDIGDTSIGMHVRHVQVPVRPATKSIGQAHVSCLRRRPKFIGGERAVYCLEDRQGKGNAG